MEYLVEHSHMVRVCLFCENLKRFEPLPEFCDLSINALQVCPKELLENPKGFLRSELSFLKSALVQPNMDQLREHTSRAAYSRRHWNLHEILKSFLAQMSDD